MPEPETNRPGERGNGDQGPAGLNGQDPAKKNLSAELGASLPPEETAMSEAGPDSIEKGHEEIAEAPADASLSEFAEDVVSGLEHVRLGAEESESFDDSGSDLPGTSEAFFGEWGSFGTGQQGASPAQQQTAESFIRPESPAPSLNALSRMSLAGHVESAGSPVPGTGKHEELADAVQSALFSIYGETAHQSAGRDFSNAATGDSASSGMSWNKGLNPDFAAPAADGLSPQDVILNYFDYSSANNNNSTQGYAPSAYGRTAPDEDQLPKFARSRPEPAAPQQRNWSARDYPAYRPERAQAETKTAQYDGPPSFSFPVPAAAPANRPGGRTGQESSKLLGAAAIGLMGGIAIAASLAAFLIYGPRPASAEIPIIGKLPLDRGDDQGGYGAAGQEEASRELQKNASTVKSAPDFSSELLAADVAAAPGQPTPLSISIRSQQPFEKTLVSISGLPEGGRLNAGVDTGGGNWLLPPRRLAGLTINLPAGAPESVPVQVQLLDSNARTPLSAKAEFVIRARPANLGGGTQIASATAAPAPRPAPSPPTTSPVSVPPTIQTAPPRIVTAPPSPAFPPVQEQPVLRRANPRPEVEDLIREGNKRMREGDIVEARQFYQKAVALGDTAGDPEAALAMGRSYDPIYFARIDKKNAEPDAAKAFEWYRKARDAGAAQTAMVRIENLKHFLNE
jgi:hypothetical protein